MPKLTRRKEIIRVLCAAGTLHLLALSASPTWAEDSLKTVPLAERVTIATQLYNGIATYYAHWKGAPDFDLDGEYKAYLDQILSVDNRRSFSLASMAFIAKLNNGHSNFYDDNLYQEYGQSFGFFAMPLHGEWTVMSSHIEAVKPGDVISAID